MQQQMQMRQQAAQAPGGPSRYPMPPSGQPPQASMPPIQPGQPPQRMPQPPQPPAQPMTLQAAMQMQQKQNRLAPVEKPQGIDPIEILQERENRWVFHILESSL